MDVSKKQLGVFLLEKTKASIYSLAFPAGVSIAIPSNTVCDMEIVSEDNLKLLIERLLASNKMTYTGVVIVLSMDFTFKNEFAEDTSENLSEKLKSFQEIVPFENVDCKIIKQEKKWKVLATNRDLCEKLKGVFEKLNIAVLGVVPYEMLRETFSELSKGFDAKLIIDRVDTIKLSSFVSLEQKVPISEKQSVRCGNKSNLSVLLIIFAVLFVVLLFVVYFNYFR